jgi:hypothetical protein
MALSSGMKTAIAAACAAIIAAFLAWLLLHCPTAAMIGAPVNGTGALASWVKDSSKFNLTLPGGKSAAVSLSSTGTGYTVTFGGPSPVPPIYVSGAPMTHTITAPVGGSTTYTMTISYTGLTGPRGAYDVAAHTDVTTFTLPPPTSASGRAESFSFTNGDGNSLTITVVMDDM